MTITYHEVHRIFLQRWECKISYVAVQIAMRRDNFKEHLIILTVCTSSDDSDQPFFVVWRSQLSASHYVLRFCLRSVSPLKAQILKQLRCGTQLFGIR